MRRFLLCCYDMVGGVALSAWGLTLLEVTGGLPLWQSVAGLMLIGYGFAVMWRRRCETGALSQ